MFLVILSTPALANTEFQATPVPNPGDSSAAIDEQDPSDEGSSLPPGTNDAIPEATEQDPVTPEGQVSPENVESELVVHDGQTDADDDVSGAGMGGDQAPDATAVPFDPVLECRLLDGDSGPVAGNTAWSFTECNLRWDADWVARLDLSVSSSGAGWELIVVEPGDANDFARIDASSSHLTLVNPDPVDGQQTTKVLLGSRVGCSADLATTVALQIEATADEVANIEVVAASPIVRSIELAATGASTPELSVQSVTFDSVEAFVATKSTAGKIEIAFTGAATCSWQAMVTFSDFINDDEVVLGGFGPFQAPPVPAFQVGGTGLTGVPGAELSGSAGVFTIFVPSAPEAVENGVLVLTVEIELPELVWPGEYKTTIVVTAGATL